MSHISSGIFLTDFFKVFEKMKIARKVPNEVKMKLFRAIDIGSNGSIDYEELISFYVERKAPTHPMSFVYNLAAMIFHSIAIRTEEALSFISINPDDSITQKGFQLISEKIFFVTKSESVAKLFK